MNQKLEKVLATEEATNEFSKETIDKILAANEQEKLEIIDKEAHAAMGQAMYSVQSNVSSNLAIQIFGNAENGFEIGKIINEHFANKES